MTTILTPPKRLPDGKGFYLGCTNEQLFSPSLRFNNGDWTPTLEWIEWSEKTRSQLIGELVSHGNWFSRPPKRAMIESLCSPWAGKDMKGNFQIFVQCSIPEHVSCSASWLFTGLTMTSSHITPTFQLIDVQENPDVDTISLFGDGDNEDDEKIIHLTETDAHPPIIIRQGRDWEAKRLMSKDRVRESRLKARIAEHMAAKEEERFQKMFGDLNDNESQFSDYDLSDGDDGSSS